MRIAFAKILKARFPNLTTEETVDLIEKLVAAVELPRGNPLDEALHRSLCGHGRLHIFCGQCAR